MNVLIIGSGGREHALAWKVAQDPRVAKVFVAPGNAGTATEAKCENVAIDVLALEQLADFAAKNVQLTIVGPEAPLVAGVVDLFRERGLDIFGPTAGAAQLEGSKAFTRTSSPATGSPPPPIATSPRSSRPWPTCTSRARPSSSRPMAWPRARA